jgi:hypothetical protein
VRINDCTQVWDSAFAIGVPQPWKAFVHLPSKLGERNWATGDLTLLGGQQQLYRHHKGRFEVIEPIDSAAIRSYASSERQGGSQKALSDPTLTPKRTDRFKPSNKTHVFVGTHLFFFCSNCWSVLDCDAARGVIRVVTVSITVTPNECNEITRLILRRNGDLFFAVISQRRDSCKEARPLFSEPSLIREPCKTGHKSITLTKGKSNQRNLACVPWVCQSSRGDHCVCGPAFGQGALDRIGLKTGRHSFSDQRVSAFSGVYASENCSAHRYSSIALAGVTTWRPLAHV